MKRPPTAAQFALILLSVLISWCFATTVDLNRLELGALFNLFFPPMLGVLTLILFTIVRIIFKRQSVRIVTLSICCVANLYLGLAFHYPWVPLPF
jgi:hypothetical protein